MKEGWGLWEAYGCKVCLDIAIFVLAHSFAAAAEQRKAEQPSVLLPPLDFPGTSFSVISYLC